MDVLLSLRGELGSCIATTIDAFQDFMVTPPDLSVGRCPAG